MTLLRTLALLLPLILNTLLAQTPGTQRFDTRGFDVELLSYGGSLGGFYSIHASQTLSFDLEADWSVVESNETFSYYDYYNQPRTINNQNLSMVKVLVGATWFPFLESMHPSLQFGTFAAAGPIVALNTADDEPFVDRWQDIETTLAPMARGGLHLRILTGQGSSYNFRLGYDYAPFDQYIDSRKTYKGLFIQVGMEFLNR